MTIYLERRGTRDNVNQLAGDGSLATTVVEQVKVGNHVTSVLRRVVHGVTLAVDLRGMALNKSRVDGVGERELGEVLSDVVLKLVLAELGSVDKRLLAEHGNADSAERHRRDELVVHDRHAVELEAAAEDGVSDLRSLSVSRDSLADLVERELDVLGDGALELALALLTKDNDLALGRLADHTASVLRERRVDTTAQTLVRRGDNNKLVALVGGLSLGLLEDLLTRSTVLLGGVHGALRTAKTGGSNHLHGQVSRKRTLVIFSMFFTLLMRWSSSRSDACAVALAWKPAAGAPMRSAPAAAATVGLQTAREIIGHGCSQDQLGALAPGNAGYESHVIPRASILRLRKYSSYDMSVPLEKKPEEKEEAQDASDLFGGMKKKSSKKKKIPVNFDLDSVRTQTNQLDAPKDEDDKGAEPVADATEDKEEPAQNTAPEATGEASGGDTLDFGDLKKKKKSKKAAFDLESFEKELGEKKDSDAPEEEPERGSDEKPETEQWQSSDRDYTYQELLHRFFRILRAQNPALSGEKRKYTMVPPIVQRDGSKKTMFANVLEICKRMHRQPEHVIQFLFTELGTVGSVDGSQRLIIRGRFQPKQIENVLRRYIVEYVTCKTCRSPNTLLTKENRIYFMTCEACGSQRSVSAIKSGFQAQTGKRSKMRQD